VHLPKARPAVLSTGAGLDGDSRAQEPHTKFIASGKAAH